MLARSEVVGAWVCSRISARASSAILSHNIPYRLEPVSEFVFGTHNAAFVQAMYEDYLRDPSSVGPEWRGFFFKGKIAGGPGIPRAAPRTGEGRGGGEGRDWWGAGHLKKKKKKKTKR